MPDQNPSVFPIRRRSHLKSETVRTLARILSLCTDEAQCLPAIKTSQEAPTLGTRDSKQEPEGLSSENVKFVGIHNRTSCPEQTVTDELENRMRPEVDDKLGCLEVSEPADMSTEKDLITNNDVVSNDDHSENIVSEQIVVNKSDEMGEMMEEDTEHPKLSSENAGVIGFSNETSVLEQIVTTGLNCRTRLERNEAIECGIDTHSPSSRRMEKDSSDTYFNNSLLEQYDVVETGDVAGQGEYKTNSDFSIKNSEEFGGQDGASAPELGVTVEFGQKMGLKGNSDHPPADNLKDRCISLEKDQVADDVGAWIDNYNNDVLVSKHIDVEQLPHMPDAVEGELLNSKSVLENDLMAKEFTMDKNDEASLSDIMKKLEYEMHQNELDLKESASYKVSAGFVSDREIEEGEISDDSGASNHSVYSSSEDAAVSQSKGEGVMNKEMFFDKCNEHKEEYGGCVQAERSGRKRKVEEAGPGILVRNQKEKDNGPKEDINCAISAEGSQMREKIPDKTVTQSPSLTSQEKQDVKARDKKKRGGSTEKRKLKKKRKRAEKNKLLGVRRLKLKPVLRPKPIAYCKHYLHGRCRQGDSCNFSHDTIPLTKSTPCNYFARNSCLKGDDCPFDHELSKYPCNNYMSKGSCIRGDQCLFSHKMLPKDGNSMSLNACKPEMESSALLDNRNSRKDVNGDGRSCSNVNYLSKKETLLGVPFSTDTILHKKLEQNVAGNRMKPLGQVPKGIMFLANENTPSDDSIKKQHGDLPPNGRDIMIMCDQKSKSTANKFQGLNELQQKVPTAVPSKGISFVSMGKLPESDPTKKGDGLPRKQVAVESVPLKLQNPNETALRMSKPPFSSGHSTAPFDKSVQGSAHKTVSSTLAFAAKYESKMGLEQSTYPPGFCAEVNKSSRNNCNFNTRDSQNGSIKASSILEEFLFGVDGTGNH